jgi:hypothetical protein
MITAEHDAIFLQTMAYDSHTAMRADGCEHLDSAFEAVEGVGFT